MSSPASSTFFSSSVRRGQQSKGTCVLSAITVCESERYFNEKQFYKLFDAQIYVRDQAVGDGLLTALKYYDSARSLPDGEAVKAFFVTVSVCNPSPNTKGNTINSNEFALEDYDLVGDVLSAYPIVNWSEDTVNPNQPPYATVSGIIGHVDETTDQIACRIELENYLGILDGRGSLTVSIITDLKSPRWKPTNSGTRRAQYLKVGQYVTATGPLTGLTRSEDNKVMALHIGADNIVNVGLASRVLGASASANTPSQATDAHALDPVTPTPPRKRFTMARLKRAREPSDTFSTTPCTPPPSNKRQRRTQAAAKAKQGENTPATEAAADTPQYLHSSRVAA
ncbi:hypothetical protein FA13DRAFT_1712411 [Coprinellus micaceus]|uniref:Uncharacterized protein n=1 Tax=Coprinellus micaceus TaxID=71717 RepID=A0A4Y7T0N0_COPMI|nr:hypothetical protein FA13DRAFT_1712411 [Coprinellus micaceus]